MFRRGDSESQRRVIGGGGGTEIRWFAEQESMDGCALELTEVRLQRLLSSL